MTKRCMLIGLLALPVAGFAASGVEAPKVLATFDADEAWEVMTSNQVTASLRHVDGVKAGAVCLDYDYNGVSGYASMRREIPIEFPGEYAIDLQLRGNTPANEFQLKFVDGSGDNVWWVQRPRYEVPTDWTPLRFRKRHVLRAWGPDTTPVLARSRYVEFTIYNNVGGKGSVCFDQLTLTPLPAFDASPLRATAEATHAASAAAHAVDGKGDTAWEIRRDGRSPPSLTLDLGSQREFGGLVLDWADGRHATDYTIELSEDGRAWQTRHRVADGDGGRDWIALPESDARFLRLQIDSAPASNIALAEAAVQPLEFAATPNTFLTSVAKDLPRGWFPRGFHGEQSYWTLLGIDGGTEQGLIGEGGAIEVARGGFSIEPFLREGDRFYTWANAAPAQSLQDGYLPIANVDWSADGLALRITGFAAGTPERSQLVARYRLHNTSDRPRDVEFSLALRPFQVNPPSQFLTTPGGLSRIGALAIDERVVQVDGAPRVYALQSADARFASTFDAGMDVSHLARGRVPATTAVKDGQGLASGAYVHRVRLDPGAAREFDVLVPLTGAAPDCLALGCDAQALQDATAQVWREKLGDVTLRLPPAGQSLADSLRSAVAHMLMSRIGARLQPGTRSYGRSWIRDGAMISEGLLRVGRSEVVRDYVELYAPYQFKNGMVPCCIDDRGSDPVPENDSHGELIFNIAEYVRYTRDLDFLRRMWPHIEGAYAYMETLRLSERTEENRARNAAFYGMMPISISHEGYSAKPVHSYWDNFWALRGYKDAVEMATLLGREDDARRMAASRDEFRADLRASLEAAVAAHGIDYLPGAAELGDFDATSTTIALAPGGEQANLPQTLLHNTFEQYWQRFVARRDGTLAWKDYTPYEWRNVGAFVRLGWRTRANEALRYFFGHRVPEPWNQWAEVVSRTPRTPFFVGDLPHAWVASDFLRSALDMFAYAREADESIVLAAGVPVEWLEGEGIALEGLHLPQGRLSYTLRRHDDRIELRVSDGIALPRGGLVLPWPYPDLTPGSTRIDGKRARWRSGELRIERVPAHVVVAID